MHGYKEEALFQNPVKQFAFSDYLIFSTTNPMIVVWRALHTLNCLFSSYFYAYLAAFGVPVYQTTSWYLDWFFQIIFLLSMILEFLTAY